LIEGKLFHQPRLLPSRGFFLAATRHKLEEGPGGLSCKRALQENLARATWQSAAVPKKISRNAALLYNLFSWSGVARNRF